MDNRIIVGLGEALWDCLPEGRKIGGAPANFAYHAAQFGYTSYAVSAVGKDALGDETIEALKANGLNVEMPCIAYYENEIPRAIKEGKLTDKDIDEAVSYILRTILYYETRKDPQEYTTNVIASDKHIAVAKKAAREMTTMLDK